MNTHGTNATRIAPRRARLLGLVLMSLLVCMATGCDSGGAGGDSENGPPHVTIMLQGPDRVAARANFEYIIHLGNRGGTAREFTVRDELPEGVSDVSLSDGGVLSGNIAVWDVMDSFLNGDSLTFSISAKAARMGKMINAASVSWVEGASGTNENEAKLDTWVGFDTVRVHKAADSQSTLALGEKLLSLGDIDGDGVGDYAISEWFSSQPWSIRTYSGSTGQVLRTIATGNVAMFDMAAVGDIDGDTETDLAVGTIDPFDPTKGEVLLISSVSGAIIRVLDAGSDRYGFGSSVAAAGDLDGDGRADVLIGDPSAREADTYSGRAFIYSGVLGTELLALDGPADGDAIGVAVANSGDLNGDVMDDFAVSNGPEILFFDGATGGILLGPIGVDGAEELIFGLTGLGDVDSDGIPDVYVGDTHKDGRGAGYVVSGATGQVVYKLEGESSEDVFGDGHSAGDLDGDGVMDLIICAWGNDAAVPDGGKVFLISGSDGSTLLSFPGLDPGEMLGLEAIVIEDVNGDGNSDYLISSGRKEVFVAAGVVL